MSEEKLTTDQSNSIGAIFESVITKKFGSKIAPQPIFFKTGIKHLDALLGNGIISSGLTMLSSTPETGKSTFAYQLAKQMIDTHENSIVVYLDTEGSGSVTESNDGMVSRVDAFGLRDSPRFSYHAIILNIMELFEVIQELVDTKKAIEEKTGKEILLFIIWDSVAGTPSSKSDTVDNPNQLIGLKGRQLSFLLDKYLPQLKFNKVFLLAIDQVRANLVIDGPFAPKESTVGEFKNLKSASNIFSLQHNTTQWLFFSKTKTITKDSFMGLEGWIISIFTEKNKIAPSKNYITCVFDKFSGIDVFWSSFIFLSEMTYKEKKTLKVDTKLPYPLLIKTTGKKSTLKVVDKAGSVLYTSESFFKKNAKKMYNENAEFKQWFDYAMDLSCYERITNGMFKIDQSAQLQTNQEIPEVNELDIEIENQLMKDPDQTQYEQETQSPDQLTEPSNHMSDEEIQQQIYQETLSTPSPEEPSPEPTEQEPIIEAFDTTQEVQVEEPAEEPVNIPPSEDYNSVF